jgi:hypothetical protein
VLFDLVARDLNDSENAENQAFLEVAAGYWLRLAMASESDCIGKLLAQFAGISRDLLASVTHRGSTSHRRSGQPLSSFPLSDGVDIERTPNYRDNQEGDNLNISVEEATDSNLVTNDPWFGIWDFGEDMSWIDIVGTPRLR